VDKWNAGCTSRPLPRSNCLVVELVIVVKKTKVGSAHEFVKVFECFLSGRGVVTGRRREDDGAHAAPHRSGHRQAGAFLAKESRESAKSRDAVNEPRQELVK